MKMAVLALPASLVALSAQQPDVNKLIAAKDWAGLEAHARARIAATPKDGAAQNLLGIALGNQGKAAEARAAFEAAVALDPKLGQAWFNLILDRAGAGDGPGTRKAFAELKKASLVIAARAADEKPVFAALADPSLPTLEWTLGEKSPVNPAGRDLRIPWHEVALRATSCQWQGRGLPGQDRLCLQDRIRNLQVRCGPGLGICRIKPADHCQGRTDLPLNESQGTRPRWSRSSNSSPSTRSTILSRVSQARR